MNGRIWKWCVLSAALASFCIAAAYFFWVEKHSSMGVRILSQEQRDTYTQYQYADLSGFLEFNGAPAAVDVDSSTIYLSQDINADTDITELPGRLTLNNEAYTLRFAPDARFSDLAAAVEEGYCFSLLAIDSGDRYMEYRVAFTTLPVMRLDGYYSHMNPEERDVMLGNVYLWAPKDPATGRYSIKDSTTEWHIRGGTTASQAKVPWKLALEKEYGKNNNVDFLGLGADDDWILNAMYIDDTRMKEHLFMQLWNAWAQQTPWNHQMSTGEYVELVLNHSYEGIYLLQRRIDEKYLQLEQEDIILKGGPSFTPQSLEEAYQIHRTPLSDEETLALIEGLFAGKDISSLDLDNFLDINLFLRYGAAVDNSFYKNMFYLLEKEAEGYRLSMLPWDTDMSWGMVWINDGGDGRYAYDYDISMAKDGTRMEYANVKQWIPELDILLAQRWQLLREKVLTEEYILSLVDQMSAQLRRSGVLHRDAERWPPYFDGADTEQMLRKFLLERLQKLDQYYGEMLQ